MNTKKCSKCKVEKPVAQYGKDRQSRDGLRNWCRECRAEYDRKRREDPAIIAKYRANNLKRHAALKANREEYKRLNNEGCRKYRSRPRNKKKVRARWMAARAFPLDGVTCQRCGKAPAEVRHHHDYDKPLEVELLCKPCGKIADQEVRPDSLGVLPQNG